MPKKQPPKKKPTPRKTNSKTAIPNMKKSICGRILETLAYISIILHLILYVLVLYRDQKLPFLSSKPNSGITIVPISTTNNNTNDIKPTEEKPTSKSDNPPTTKEDDKKPTSDNANGKIELIYLPRTDNKNQR
ncbi:hypothetical protein [Candidatus Phytoplasma pruni]|uniref:Uncharacterized protein n=1 Tax=Candidatus Phytoplasma pruni TaxID=479893 RepID=A0A851HJ01_9MOLU|nr:hypothetical protein [Candidatus Phytoplasma pruni]NWN45526.1 hypothetical protein [Candidatus Phytoplasma pruni]